MMDCQQMPGLSVLAHGQSVWAFYQDLHNHIVLGEPLKFEWRLPDWIHSKALWEAQAPTSTIEEYAVHHDCGKPFCRVVDSEGRQHFPDHALWSEKVWRATGGSDQAARLMGMDMDIHLLKADGLEAFASRPEWGTLLVVGLCEVHSNATMFGGIDSNSFKMKWKQISRRGKALVK